MISVLLPIMFTAPEWQVPMTEYAIKCLSINPGAEFELVIVETGSKFFENTPAKHIHIPEKSQWTKDANIGLKACEGEFVVHTGNDIFARPGWATALLQPFNDYADCGISCLASGDLPAPLSTAGDFTVEGVYGPFMMFRREAKVSIPHQNKDGNAISFDEDFPDIFSDTDLILAHYAAGLRSYRNHRCRIEHLNKATYDALHTKDEQTARHQKYGQQMAEKHYATCSHLRMYHHLIDGHVV